MSNRDLLVLVQMALLAVCFINTAPMANAASTDRSVREPGRGARSYVLEPERRGRGVKIHLPIGPAYIYYDYPYYYSRGYYPTHIGGYIYYPNYTRNFYPRYGGRCAIEHRGCVANVGKFRRGYCRCP